jgi:hypothetical protein
MDRLCIDCINVEKSVADKICIECFMADKKPNFVSEEEYILKKKLKVICNEM